MEKLQTKSKKKNYSNFLSRLEYVRNQVNENGVEGLQINPNTAVFQFRKGANHTRL